MVMSPLLDLMSFLLCPHTPRSPCPALKEHQQLGISPDCSEPAGSKADCSWLPSLPCLSLPACLAWSVPSRGASSSKDSPKSTQGQSLYLNLLQPIVAQSSDERSLPCQKSYEHFSPRQGIRQYQEEQPCWVGGGPLRAA